MEEQQKEFHFTELSFILKLGFKVIINVKAAIVIVNVKDFLVKVSVMSANVMNASVMSVNG